MASVVRHSIRQFSSSVPEITRVGVVGMGLMGHGIVQTAASKGFEVVAVDANQASLEKGVAAIENSVSMLASKAVKGGKMEQDAADQLIATTMGAITPASDVSALENCDIVIEAIIEDIGIKLPFYENLGKIVQPNAIFASNTSSLPVTDMGNASGRPDKMVGLHFFNPVQLMKLVEVIRGEATSDAAFDTAMRFTTALGKKAVPCTDTPGFIVNRLLVPYLAQAMALVDRGVATPEDVDTAMQLGAGHPMGPLTLADYVGLDTSLSILQGWRDSNPDMADEFPIPANLQQKVTDGKFGRKSGEGFYKWDGNKKL